MTLRERLVALFPEASGHRRKQWLATGRVRVNGRVARDGRVAVAAADAVELGVAAGRVAPAPLPGGVRIVHEDEDLVVVDKPPGLLTIATERERERTAYRIVRSHVSKRRPGPVFIVHRLDRETSGLIVLARTMRAKRHLQAQFAARSVERVYLAVVRGMVRADRGTLVSQLVEDESLRVRPAADRRGRAAAPGAREAITDYRVRERRRGTTLLELTLGTGRRRQIRVQLSELGHPIVGDSGAPRAAGARPGRRAGPGFARAGRLLLHALRLGFEHPGTGE
ncbi:MAG TPA: RluA family pseudouridine synthase, partial [Candidatus Binatia bacterium]|nr:RluA family pseudouridine synthase [Candidatus Binatia bacterium]